MTADERETRVENLYIPVNIKTRMEFFDGYGAAELGKSIVVAAVALFAAFFIYTLTANTTVCVMIFLVSVAASVMAQTKDQNGLSVIDNAKFIVRFMNGQRKFDYEYSPEWGEIG